MLEGEHYADYTYLDGVRDRDQPLTLERVLRRNPIYIGSLVPAEVGQSVGWFDPELFGTEDFGLWLKILERGFEAILNPEPLAVYRRHAGTVSSDIARQGANNRRTYELALARGHLNRTPTAHRAREPFATTARWRRWRGRASRRDAADRSAELIPMVPLLAWVAVTNPRWWGQWLAILRTGRQPPVARTR